MKPRLSALLLLLLPAIATAAPRPDAARPLPLDPSQACQAAVQAAERTRRLPAQLLTAISLVESGRVDPASGRVVAWPWTINAGGIGFFYDTKAQAIAAARAMHVAGVASIDVGCVQISLLFHPDAFATLEEAFDPAANAAYGALFLAGLYRQLGTWPAATAAYHSQTPELGAAYAQMVMARWPLAAKFAPSPGAPGAPPVAEDSRYTPAFRALVAQARAAGARLLARPATAANDSLYTPAFRAQLQQTRADTARLLALYGPHATPARPVPAAARPAPRPAMPASAAPIWTADADGHDRPDLLTSR